MCLGLFRVLRSGSILCAPNQFDPDPLPTQSDHDTLSSLSLSQEISLEQVGACWWGMGSPASGCGHVLAGAVPRMSSMAWRLRARWRASRVEVPGLRRDLPRTAHRAYPKPPMSFPYRPWKAPWSLSPTMEGAAELSWRSRKASAELPRAMPAPKLINNLNHMFLDKTCQSGWYAPKLINNLNRMLLGLSFSFSRWSWHIWIEMTQSTPFGHTRSSCIFAAYAPFRFIAPLWL
jgi:hypothetical protein